MGYTKEVFLGNKTMPLRRFKLDWLNKNPSICMIAKRGSGKSWVCRDILRQFSDIPGGLIISPTDEMSSFYGKFFPELYIHYTYESKIIERLLYRQRIMIQKKKEKKEKGKKIDVRSFLLMDDCLSSKTSWMKDQPIQEMFFNGRHYKIMFILTMQFPLGITPELRSNFDFVFLLAEDFISNQKRLYDHYAGMFPDFISFKQVFQQVTADYGAMVIVNRGAHEDFLDKVFWYRATNTDIKKMGNRQFRTYADNNYNKNWANEKWNKFDVDKFVEQGKAKSRPFISVSKEGFID